MPGSRFAPYGLRTPAKGLRQPPTRRDKQEAGSAGESVCLKLVASRATARRCFMRALGRILRAEPVESLYLFRSPGQVKAFSAGATGGVRACGQATADQGVAEGWRVRESARVTPSSKSIGAAWLIRSQAPDGREVWTSVDVSLAAMDQLENGSVADETRLALRTQGRSPVEAAVKRGDDPPARIVCSASGCKAR
jgi:hypothetical protein